MGIGVAGVGKRQIAAMWCTLATLRGVMSGTKKGGKMAKTARWIARAVTDLWDDTILAAETPDGKEDAPTLDLIQTEHIKGLNPLTTLLDKPPLSSTASSKANQKRTLELQAQHTSLVLHLLATSHSILPTSITLPQHTLYPLLQGLLSPVGLVSMTAYTALSETAHALGYALSSRLASFSSHAHFSPLQSNTPTVPSLSIQALQVLRALIRPIGPAIIDRGVVVQALVDILNEILDAVGREDDGTAQEDKREDVGVVEEQGEERWEEFVKRFKERNTNKPENGSLTQPDPVQIQTLSHPVISTFLHLSPRFYSRDGELVDVAPKVERIHSA
ncbi:hypothetical protein FRC07_005115 [Ceratobasidium sp. 392]|nr:hypothetical protein FRC07_005115 [Ceratobasidium sp. 392]